MTLDEWVAQFELSHENTRELWKAIRWEFEQQQPPMTVRQMFYRMSAQGHVDKSQSGYRSVAYHLKNMRLDGAIPFEWIADNTRWVHKPPTYDTLRGMLEQSQMFYRRALAGCQTEHVVIFLEKDALAGMVSEITNQYDVPLYVSRGFASLSYLYHAAQNEQKTGKSTVVYHLGDYDASGQEAGESLKSRLAEFGLVFDFHRAAVTLEQIQAWDLPVRPQNKKDPRAKKWGNVAVDLDAIPPRQLRELVAGLIERHIDRDELNRLLLIEESERVSLSEIAENLP